MLFDFKFMSPTKKSSQYYLTTHHKSGSKAFDSKTASFFYENIVLFNVAELTSFAAMIEKRCAQPIHSIRIERY